MDLSSYLIKNRKKCFSWVCFLLICFIIFFSACADRIMEDIALDQLWDCHFEKSWEETEIEKELEGNWKLKGISCYAANEFALFGKVSSIFVEFRTDKTLTVREGNRPDVSVEWSLNKLGDDLYALEMSENIFYLNGRMLFCGEELQFGAAYIDLCDHYFVREK